MADFFKFGASRGNVAASTLQFQSIDIDGTSKRLRLGARAKESCQRDLPASDSQSFDAVEQEIANEIEYEVKKDFDRYLENQKTYVDRAGSLAIQSLVIQIGTIATGAITDFAKCTHSGSNELYLLKKDLVETEQELERFRSRHRLERPARNLGPKALKYGFLALILLGESIANGLFLQKGSSLGLLGGIGEAMIIAFINVTIGIIAGSRAAPWVTHRNWLGKIAAVLTIVGLSAGAIAFNLFVAHYRIAMGVDPFEAAHLAIDNFRADPTAISDAQSLMLFGIGLIFSLAAAADGWIMNDPYPGYGRVTLEHRDAADFYTEQKAELLAELEQIKQRAEEAMEECIRDINARQGEYDNILMKSQSLQAAMAQHFDHLISAANTLLRIYRGENLKCRKTPPPPRFDQSWTYQKPSLEKQTIPDRIREQIDAALKTAMEEVPRRRDDLHKAYLEAIATYRKIDDLTAEDLT